MTERLVVDGVTDGLGGGEAQVEGYWPPGQKSGDTVFNHSRQGTAVGTLTWLSGAYTPFRSQKMMIIIR